MNETTRLQNFKSDRWYRVRLRVTPKHIEAWIDGKQVVKEIVVPGKLVNLVVR